MNTNLVSIIIPTYNRAHLIGETLESIINQTYTDWECIIVDDGSTDGTERLLKEYSERDKRLKFYIRPKSLLKGANVCRNYGLKKSKGHYIQFFDSDDIMMPNLIGGRVSVFLENNIDIVVFNYKFLKDKKITESINPITTVKNWEEALEHFIGSYRLPWNIITVMYKASFFKEKIYFNESLNRFQDIEFNIRLLYNLRPKFLVIPQQDCYYRLASINNIKSAQFYINIFSSVPTYYKTLDATLSEKFFLKHVKNLQNWIFNLTSLYTNKKVSLNLYISAINSAKKYVHIDFVQYISLILLFFLKKYFKSMVGHVKIYNFLKAVFNK